MPWLQKLPNILSVCRIVGAMLLLPESISELPFWLLFLFCGVSDMADGWVARKYDAATTFGSRLDSVADVVFIVCCCCKLLPAMTLPFWLWLWAGAIAILKLANQVLSLAFHGRLSFLHTTANRLTGLLLFIVTPICIFSDAPYFLALVAVIATYAAVQEGRLIFRS